MSVRSDWLRGLADAAEHSMRTGEDFYQYMEILAALRGAANRLDDVERQLRKTRRDLKAATRIAR